MTQTVSVERLGNTAVTSVDLVHSPDDGGWYLRNADFRQNRSRASIAIYPSAAAARAAWNDGSVRWEPWS